jgi:hypothetical protein
VFLVRYELDLYILFVCSVWFSPISLLNSLGKLFEKIILKRLNFELRKLKAIRNDEYGFNRGHSTTHVGTWSALRTVSTTKLQSPYS